MTETERIYEEKWLPEKFWKEEVICDYLVSEKMKKVWAIELDLYREFARVCEKNNLSFFTCGGTLLGAVRHRGFIPWDDDFDVYMPRESYEKLKELSCEFKTPYFFQNAHTDKEFGFSFMRLRNSNTTVVVESFNYCTFNQGIYLDIFPLDKVKNDTYLTRRKKISELIKRSSAYMRRNFPPKTEKDRILAEQYNDSTVIPSKLFDEIEKIAMEDEYTETEYLSSIVTTIYPASNQIWPSKAFDGYIEMDFESIKVRVPVGYNEYLKILFGNYMEFPPLDKRGGWHKNEFYPDIPYKKFYRENYGLIYD